MNFGNCCIRARKAHTSMRKFSKENLTVKVSGAIVDAHLIPMKFRIKRQQLPRKNMYNAKALIHYYSWNESTSRTTSWIAWAFFCVTS